LGKASETSSISGTAAKAASAISAIVVCTDGLKLSQKGRSMASRIFSFAAEKLAGCLVQCHPAVTDVAKMRSCVSGKVVNSQRG
jgi:hypothetical protein